MKKIITFALASLMVLSLSYDVQAQDKKAEKKARKEARKQERAIKDSLMTLMEGSDSVNVGYGYVKKNRMSTPSSRRGANKDIASYTDIADYIQATEPGVIVQKNGGSARYLIRGIGTNSSATDPLLMVDGVQVDSFDSILPSQVDAIEVIKDGSASIYGMQGANGVIMITTKKD